MMQPSVDLVVFVHFITCLFVLQGSLHRGPVLHLLSEPAVACTGHVLLLHGRPDATHCRLLVLQHVCEAFGIQQKKEGRERERERGGKGGYEERRIPNQIISHSMDAATADRVAI